MTVACELTKTSDKYLGENLDCSPVKVISIRYTTAPLVLRTGSHFSEIEVKFLLVTVGMLGFGGKEPSPASMEEKFCNCAKNSQLFKQLLALLQLRLHVSSSEKETPHGIRHSLQVDVWQVFSVSLAGVF